MGPLVRELLARLFELRQLLELALHGRDALGLVAHASFESFEAFFCPFFLLLAGLFSS